MKINRNIEEIASTICNNFNYYIISDIKIINVEENICKIKLINNIDFINILNKKSIDEVKISNLEYYHYFNNISNICIKINNDEINTKNINISFINQELYLNILDYSKVFENMINNNYENVKFTFYKKNNLNEMKSFDLVNFEENEKENINNNDDNIRNKNRNKYEKKIYKLSYFTTYSITGFYLYNIFKLL